MNFFASWKTFNEVTTYINNKNEEQFHIYDAF